MNKKFLILLLALSLSSCAKDNNEEKVEVLSSGIKIESVSQKDHIKQKETEMNSSSINEKMHEERESKSSTNKNKNEKEDNSKKETYTDDYKAHRRAIVEYGKFSWVFANSLSDQKIRAYYDKAKDLSEKTGYWDIKDFVFQEIAKDYPNKSEKFPLDSIDEVYKWKKSEKDEITDKFNDEREEFINKGFRKKDVYELKDKEIEEAFKEAYKKDSSLYYDGYIKLASEIIKENHPRITNDMDNRIYDKFREDLYTMYDFNKDVALSVTNNDIDEANKRAKKKLEEVKYGDIGLVLQELKKMYPDWNK